MQRVIKLFQELARTAGSITIELGKPLHRVAPNSLVFFPDKPNTLGCGISALVAFKGASGKTEPALPLVSKLIKSMPSGQIEELGQDISGYLGGASVLSDLTSAVQELKRENRFTELFFDPGQTEMLEGSIQSLGTMIQEEEKGLRSAMASLSAQNAELISARIDMLKDAAWCLDREILKNIHAIRRLTKGLDPETLRKGLFLYKRINAVLNSLDRLEVRGRDSAGISVLATLTRTEFENFAGRLKEESLSDRLKKRSNQLVLSNNSISISETTAPEGTPLVSISFVYKFAAEIGALGDNIAFIRNQIRTDHILQILSGVTLEASSVSAHTRWASVGDITEANCHPVDNTPTDSEIPKSGIIHVCLNGDIDNYLELKTEYEARYDKIHPTINTDTKLIPLQVEHHLKQGAGIEEAFRLALNEFHGSHAISMQTDLAPGKIFLAQKGSGQAIFVGIAPDHYIAASELYGVVEETQDYIKLNGEDRGQIVVLDQHAAGGIEGIRSFYYDNTPIELTRDDVLTSQITSRDIDRQDFPHYFLKEISESCRSVEKTMENRFKADSHTGLNTVSLDNSVIPATLEEELASGTIRKIFFIGQGTAGIAAQGCADLLSHYLGEHRLEIRALKSSEMSGFCIVDNGDSRPAMTDTLVVAISQSGTTTDTNRTVDMVKACGAKALAIVNRRDSDLTFKTDGVLYTSSGRDIEMSVASTKAFYSQLTAGAILGLHLASQLKTRSPEYISREIGTLTSLPDKMQAVLDMKDQIRESAFKRAVSKTYWATVGSGANKTSADEIRIKLSELCYKTISADFVEDKKHIDLSAEPLILVCAAGTRESVLGDIIKDTAIFHAHKACPIVITTEGETRFDLYAADVFKVPEIPEHLAPVLNTLVGHIWGYYAALAINEGSRFMYEARSQVQDVLDDYRKTGRDAYEVLLGNRFRETIAGFDTRFSKRRRENGFPTAMGLDTTANITLLLKYLSGRLPVSDFEIDFGVKGTPSNMIAAFFDNMGQAVNTMARPVDAIKHQAKTVTVGTSRISETFDGLVFDALADHKLPVSQITNKNVLVIKNLQEVISEVKGALLYRVSGLNLLGAVTPETRIEVVSKSGSLQNEVSRVETDGRLQGTKNIIVREGNVYIGKGRKDNRSILVIPVISSSPSGPSTIEYILSLHVGFKTTKEVSLLKKIKALGGKYTRLKDWILESENIVWDDKYLNLVEIETLFGASAEKAVEALIREIN
jgi:glucosamine--fructose-6-phosphate aminotransferase (isomerizing)